jgi:hypothetical protein
MPDSTLILCQSRLYPPVRDLGFGLWSLRLRLRFRRKEVKILIYIFMVKEYKDPIQRQRFFSFYVHMSFCYEFRGIYFTFFRVCSLFKKDVRCT